VLFGERGGPDRFEEDRTVFGEADRQRLLGLAVAGGLEGGGGLELVEEPLLLRGVVGLVAFGVEGHMVEGFVGGLEVLVRPAVASGAGVILHGYYGYYPNVSCMTTPDPVVLGGALRALRVEAGLSQRELCERVDLDKPYLSRLEGGHRDIRWSMLARLLNGLDASLADLQRALADTELSQRKNR
jgi:DNA-binding Xre family transcriptional regulator